MGFRFQRRVKLLPGITLNISKSGLSTSFGVRGARVTVGHGKTRTTLGIPGTGISHTSVTPNRLAQTQASSVFGLSVGQLFLLGLTSIAWFLWLMDPSSGWLMRVYIALTVACGLLAWRRGRSMVNWMCLATYATPVIAFGALLVQRNLALPVGESEQAPGPEAD
jgi:hypothetical protein